MPQLTTLAAKKTSKRSSAHDLHIGARLRLLREARGVTQVRLARELGLSFQQLQKYEHGENRVSASRLFEMARLLDAEVGYFFEGLVREAAAPGFEPPDEAAELYALFLNIRDVKVRNQMRLLMEALASAA
jgi:transcriptional regulator with XRE-family HTH domain